MAKREGAAFNSLAGLGEAFGNEQLPAAPAAEVSPQSAEETHAQSETRLHQEFVNMVGDRNAYTGYTHYFAAPQQPVPGAPQRFEAQYMTSGVVPNVREGERTFSDGEPERGRPVFAPSYEQNVSGVEQGSVTLGFNWEAGLGKIEAAADAEDLAVKTGEAVEKAEATPKKGKVLNASVIPGAKPEGRGDLSNMDRAEREAVFAEVFYRLEETKNELGKLHGKSGNKKLNKIKDDLYRAQDAAEVELRRVMGEVARDAFNNVHPGDDKALERLERLKKQAKGKDIVASGLATHEELVQLHETESRYRNFVKSLAREGAPEYAAKSIFARESADLAKLDERLARAKAGDVNAFGGKEGKHLRELYGISEELLAHITGEAKTVHESAESVEINEPVPTPVLDRLVNATEKNPGALDAIIASESGTGEGTMYEDGSKVGPAERKAVGKTMYRKLEKVGPHPLPKVPEEGAAAPETPLPAMAVDPTSLEKARALSAAKEAVIEGEILDPVAMETFAETPEQEPLIIEGEVIKEKPHVVSKEVLTKFGELGVGIGDLEKLKGFDKLSEGQQLLMLENYNKCLRERSEREGTAEYEQKMAKRPFLGKMGLGIVMLGLYGKISEKRHQRDIARKLTSGESFNDAERQELLGSFMEFAKGSPSVTRTPEGLRINYVNDERWKGSPEKAATVERYNDIASKYAKIPKQWIEADLALPREEQGGFFRKLMGNKNLMLTGKEQAQVAEIREEYEKVRAEMLAVLSGEGADESATRAAALELNHLDERVTLDQLFASDPNAERTLQDIRDENIFARTIGEFARNRGKYMAIGSIARASAVAVSSALALPAGLAIAAGTSYVQSKREQKDLLKRRRASGVLGEEDLREEVPYTADRNAMIESRTLARDEAFKRGDVEAATRAQQEIEELQREIRTKGPLERRTRQLKEFSGSDFFVDRIERLTTRLEVARDMGDQDAVELIERKIAQTATLMRSKLKDGQIGFGKGGAGKGDARAVLNRVNFIQALAKADAAHALDAEKIEEMVEKATQMTEHRREELDAAARKRANKNIVKAVVVRTGFALAGYGLTHAVMGHVHLGGHQVEAGAHSGAGATHEMPPVTSAGQALHEAGLDHEQFGGVHEVVRGDTLTAIARKFPEIAKLPTHEQNVAIASMVGKLSPEQLHDAGIMSGDADIIRVGEHVDLGKLHEHFAHMKVGNESLVEHAHRVSAHTPSMHGTHHTVHAHESAPQPIETEHVAAPGEQELPPVRPLSSAQAAEMRQHAEGAPLVAHSAEGAPGTPGAHELAEKVYHERVGAIFGKKNVFGQDRMDEWNGNPARHLPGLKNSTVEGLLGRRGNDLIETPQTRQVDGMLRELMRVSGVKPNPHETVDAYMHRALEAHETASAAAHEVVARPPTIASVIEHAMSPVHHEHHSTGEAMSDAMPKLVKLMDPKDNIPGVRENVLANFIRQARPEDYAKMGFDGDAMYAQLHGHADAGAIHEFFQGHNADGSAIAEAAHHAPAAAPKMPEVHHEVPAPKTPEAHHEAPAAPKASDVHHEAPAAPKTNVAEHAPAAAPKAPEVPPTVSADEAAKVEKGFDDLPSFEAREAAAGKLIPRYLEDFATNNAKGIDAHKFIEYIHRAPSNVLYASNEQLAKHGVPPEYIEAIGKMRGFVTRHDIIREQGMADGHASLFDYFAKYYHDKLIYDGVAATKAIK